MNAPTPPQGVPTPITPAPGTPTPTPIVVVNEESRYETLDEFIERTETALINAQLVDIEPKMAVRGILKVDVKAKLQDVQALRALVVQHKKEYGEQYKATEDYDNARNAVHEDYMDDLAMARLAFEKDTVAKTALELRGSRKASKGGYAGQGFAFYDNALKDPAYVAALGKKGISLADLQARQAAFGNLKTLSAAQQKETGEAQAATVARDAMHDALAAWMTAFYVTARVALRKFPQLMEKVGIVEKR